MSGAKAGVDVETRDGGAGGSFSEERLVDKLNKLNNTAASIQSILFLFLPLLLLVLGVPGCFFLCWLIYLVSSKVLT
jgi:hypothetical protein